MIAAICLIRQDFVSSGKILSLFTRLNFDGVVKKLIEKNMNKFPNPDKLDFVILDAGCKMLDTGCWILDAIY